VHDARPAVRLRAAQQRAHARGELRHREGLHHVVVGAELEEKHAVDLRTTCSQHDDRRRALRPQHPAQIGTVDVGQTEVEQNQIGGVGGHCLRSGTRVPHGVALALESLHQRRGNRVFVFDQQHPRWR
jgi:hypothetical protein